MIDHLVDHLFSTKEDRPLVGLERAKARIGTRREAWRHRLMRNGRQRRHALAATSQVLNAGRHAGSLRSKSATPLRFAYSASSKGVLDRSRTAQGSGRSLR